MPNWVGDCVMATPAIKLLRAGFPGAHIAALCRPSLAGILQTNPDLNEIIPLDERKLSPADSARIRAQKFDICILLTNSLRAAWVAWKLGCKKRIGFARNYRSFLLTHPVPFDITEWQSSTPKPLSKKSHTKPPQPGFPRHMVMYYLRLAETALKAFDPGVNITELDLDYSLQLPLAPEAKQDIKNLLAKHNLQNKVLIGINPGAAHGAAKRWPPERLSHLIEGLNRPDWAFVSTASKFESHLNDEIQKDCNVPLYRLGEETSLAQLPALIDKLAILVTNDSGPMHIAAARKIPIIAFFGPTDSASTSPWQSIHLICEHPVPCSPCFLRECPIDHPCMKNIENYSVAESLLKLLRQSGAWKAL